MRGVLLLGAALLSCVAVCQVTGQDEWWKTATIYQIYPKSFKDSNNDGTGDLPGIYSKLQYLKDTGIDAVWISPFQPSGGVDAGYDVTDYKGVDPLYGTMDDFDAIVAKSKEIGLMVLVDIVPNHSSIDHPWFQLSANRTPGYEDYYVWKDPKGTDSQGNPIPPTTWNSAFHGSAWEFHEGRQQFYLHQFKVPQADLNYRNPLVVEEMKSVFEFWLDHGVQGFRIDTPHHLFEDERFLDEPIRQPEGNSSYYFNYYDHIYTMNQDESFEMVYDWRAILDRYAAADGIPKFLTMEQTSYEFANRFYGTAERPGASSPFNFLIIDRLQVGFKAQEMKQMIDLWMDNMLPNNTANWLVGNHDQHRVYNRMGPELVDGMLMVVTLLPGVTFTYNGEEIAMEDNYEITYEQGQDGCEYPPEEYLLRSRDPPRTPFQWDNTTNAGFNEGTPTWLPIPSNYVTKNLQAQVGKPYSHYEIYKDLMRAKKTPAIKSGNLVLNVVGIDTLGFIRGLGSSDYFLVLVNCGDADDIIDLDAGFYLGTDSVLTIYTASENSGLLKGNTVVASSVPLRAKSSVVLRVGALP